MPRPQEEGPVTPKVKKPPLAYSQVQGGTANPTDQAAMAAAMYNPAIPYGGYRYNYMNYTRGTPAGPPLAYSQAQGGTANPMNQASMAAAMGPRGQQGMSPANRAALAGQSGLPYPYVLGAPGAETPGSNLAPTYRYGQNNAGSMGSSGKVSRVYTGNLPPLAYSTVPGSGVPWYGWRDPNTGEIATPKEVPDRPDLDVSGGWAGGGGGGGGWGWGGGGSSISNWSAVHDPMLWRI